MAGGDGQQSNESIWHQRFGHLGEKSLQRLAKEKLVTGFNYDVSKGIELCESCVRGKIIHIENEPKSLLV